jgi:hypothetical protein
MARRTQDRKDWRKKMAAQRAAKFREETPRKGGGLAIQDRDTALQQYEEVAVCAQVRNDTLSTFLPRKPSKNPA